MRTRNSTYDQQLTNTQYENKTSETYVIIHTMCMLTFVNNDTIYAPNGLHKRRSVCQIRIPLLKLKRDKVNLLQNTVQST